MPSPIIIEKTITPIVKKLVEEYWLTSDTDKILIISDYPSATDFATKNVSLLSEMIERNLLARSIKDIISSNYPNEVNNYFISPTYQNYKIPNDPSLIKKVKEVDIVFALTHYSLTNVGIFAELLEKKRIKLCSSPLVVTEDFHPQGPIDVNVSDLEKTTQKINKLMNRSNHIKVLDPSGSSIEITVSKSNLWYCDTGILKEKGQFANIPAGETGIDISDPLDDIIRITGKLNIFPGWTEDLSEQATIWIRDNFVVEVKGGGKKGQILEKLLKKNKIHLIQFGIGTNPNAKNPLSLIQAEKIKGMGHISLSFIELNENHFFFPVDRIIVDGIEYTKKRLFSLKED